MPVPTSFTDLSTTPSSNSPAGSETPAEGDNYLRTIFAMLSSIMSNSGNGWTSPYATTAALGSYLPLAGGTVSGNLTVQGNTTIGDGSGDSLTVAPNAVTWSNSPTHSGSHTWSGVQTYSANPAGRVIGSTYTPTLTNTSNISSSSVVGAFKYMRIGNIVHAAGRVTIDTTAGGGTSTTLGITLPIASSLTDAHQLSGGSSCGSSLDVSLGVEGDATNDRATLTFVSGSTSNRAFQVWFDYEVV